MEITTTQRKSYFDVLKLFAIFIVLWGHCVQFMGGGYFWDNPVFGFIYSFHMPLFMVVSGYFFSSSLHNSFGKVLKKKTMQLLLPVVSWAVIITLSVYLSELFIRGNKMDIPVLTTKILLCIKGDLWFLKCLFSCYMLSYISMRVFKNVWFACLMANLFFLFIPSLFAEIFLLPFFWMGFFINKYSQWIEKYKSELLVTSSSLYLILFNFWTGRDTIYATPMHTLINWQTFTIEFTNYGMALFRFFIGAMGAMSVILFFSKYVKDSWLTRLLAKWGSLTMGIYIVQYYLLQVWLSRYDLPEMSLFTYNYVVTPLLSILLLFVAIFCCRIIQKNRFTNFLFLGHPL